MALFPPSPANGQTANVDGIQYTYSSSQTAWVRSGTFVGNAIANTVTASGNITANFFIGNGSQLTGITATTANTVTDNAQPNITSVGTLTGLSVNGNITAANITANTGVFTGNGAGLSQLAGANVTGTVANATFATSAGSATTAGTVTTAAQPNITSVGNLTALTVTGNTFLATTSGNVGVGVSSASTKMDVDGGEVRIGEQTAGNGAWLNVNLRDGTTASAAIRVSERSSASSSESIPVTQPHLLLNRGSDSLGSFIKFTNARDGYSGIGSLATVANGHDIRLYTGTGTEKLRVDANGNVGIGNTSPTHALSVTGTTNISGNLSAGNISTSGVLSVTGNANVSNLGTGRVIATGNISGTQLISNIAIGTAPLVVTSTTQVANLNAATAGTATSATTAGTVTTAAQPNITSVGTLTSLSVTGNANVGNIGATNGVFTSVSGNGSALTALNASNISSGTLAQARLANSNVVLGNTTLALGTTTTTIAGLSSVTSTTFVGALTGAATTAGTVTTAAQPNITSVGALTSLTVTGNTFLATTSGNVGIGTTSPGYRLDVASSGTSAFRVSGPVNVLSDLTDGTITLRQQIGGEAAIGTVGAHPFVFRTNNAERMRIDASGNVGIGTSSPGAALDIGGEGFFQISSSGTSRAKFFADASLTYLTSEGARPLTLSTNSAERMRIDSSGNVGIGTTNPLRKLDISGGGFAFTDSGGASRNIHWGDTTNIFPLLIGGDARSGAGFLSFSTNTFGNAAIERMRIDSGGNVGIGQATGINARLSLGALVSNKVFSLYDDGTNQYGMGIAGSQYRMFASTGAVISFGNYARSTDTFSETVRIDSSGNVGIGTSPVSQNGRTLQVDGGAGAADYRLTNNSTGAGANNGGLYSLIGLDNYLWNLESGFLSLGTNNTERMRIDSSGNVGIGTSTPAHRLDVNGNIRGGILIASSSVGYRNEFNGFQYNEWRNEHVANYKVTGNTYAYYWRTSDNGASDGANQRSIAEWYNNRLVFFTDNVERMRIDSSGNVGIGTSSPATRLSVNAASGSTQIADFTNTSAGSTLSGIVVSIESGGNNTNSFHFAGVTQTVALYYLFGNGTTSYTSDIRVKKNVETTRDGYLADIAKLRVVKYNWYNDSDDTPRELGFIAQEVEKVFPGLVQDALHPTKDGVCHKVLKASVLVPILTKALQEANSKIDALEARMSALESAITNLSEGN